MNAQTPHTDPLTQAAIQNGAVLRAIASQPAKLTSPGEVAHAAGVPTKNIARTMLALSADGLVRLGGAGVYELTATGERALDALDVWEGRVARADGPANDVLLLRHHQIRRNPLNARKLDLTDPRQREELDGLKAQIVAAGDVLQNLVVFPADAEGMHDLFAGERRWTAIGELIEEGQWDRHRPLRAIQRDNTPGQTAFISLVENSQVSLTVLERARAYRTLCEDTGWSGREAALRTGWDVKSVQQYLQVLRDADPEHIAAHEAGDPDWTWEALRKSVQKSQEPEVLEPEQGDIEEVARGAETITGPQRFSQADQEQALSEYRRGPGNERAIAAPLSGKTTASGETWPAGHTECLATPYEGFPRAKIYLTVSDRGRWHMATSTHAGGPSFAGYSGPTSVWTNDLIFENRASALAHAAERVVDQLGDWGRKRKLLRWLVSLGVTPTAQAEDDADPLTPTQRRVLREIAARSIHRHRLLDGCVTANRAAISDPDFQALYNLEMVTRRPGGDDRAEVEIALTLSGRDHLRSRDQDPKDGLSRNSCTTPWLREPGAVEARATAVARPAPTPVDAPLSPIAMLALVELADKLSREPVEPTSTSGKLVRVFKYWLDTTSSDLRALGLVDFTHGWTGGPHALLTYEGRHKLKTAGFDAGVMLFNEIYNARLKAGVKPERARDEAYVTPWLNEVAADEQRKPEPAPGLEAALGADEEDPQEIEDSAILAELEEAIEDHDLNPSEALSFFERLSIPSPFRPLTGDAAGGLADAEGEEYLTVDINRDNTDARAEAIARLIAHALRRLAQPSPYDPPLVEIRKGDIVHKGTTATAYRILERLDDGDHQSQGLSVPRFKVQTIRNGRDYGTPVTINFTDIYGLVPEARA
ncbi:MAG: ParB/Srx family N-terminal domain-containing protein [Pseudomonadota bacterium]